MSESSAEGRHLVFETLISILILMLYTIAAPLFEKYHFHYMHESGVCMIIGVIVTLLAMVISPKSNFTNTFQFNDEIFFTFILPPIIFAAGYNLRRASFFKYFIYIFCFGVIGTIITFLVVSPLTYIANEHQMFYFTFYNKEQSAIGSNLTHMVSDHERFLLSTGGAIIENLNSSVILPDTGMHQGEIINFSIKEILLFASVISATDTIAALTFIKEESEPKLFAILFGEGVINDAVCIVLYRILRDFTSSNEEFTTRTPLIMINSFLNLFFFSFIMGTVVGCISSLFLKKLKEFHLNRVQECSIIIFFAFISYTLSEEMGLSPIIALLFTGIFMSHYTFYNLSFQAREESAVVSRLMSNVAEAFVFTYLGLTLVYYMTHALSLTFIIYELIFVVLGRILAIFGLAFIMKLFKIKNFKMKTSEKGIMSCAGSIRGAIAFGLAISIDSKNKLNKEVLISSTLILVFFTTIVFGALMPFLIRLMKKLDSEEGKDLSEPSEEPTQLYTFLHPNFSEQRDGQVKEKNIEVLKNRLSYWLGHYWVEFDFVYMKPRLVFNWPQVKTDNDSLTKLIQEAIHQYSSRKFHMGIDTDKLIQSKNEPQEMSTIITEPNEPPPKAQSKLKELTGRIITKIRSKHNSRMVSEDISGSKK